MLCWVFCCSVTYTSKDTVIYVSPTPIINFGSNRASMGVAYDVIFSIIAGLPKVYPNFFDVPHGVLQ